MKKPTKVRAGFYTWKINWTSEKADETFGKTDMNRKTITIYKQDNEEIDRETLMHELLHVALEDKVDSVFDNVEKRNDEKEENLIRLLSPVLIQILNDNKKLTKYLFNV